MENSSKYFSNSIGKSWKTYPNIFPILVYVRLWPAPKLKPFQVLHQIVSIDQSKNSFGNSRLDIWDEKETWASSESRWSDKIYFRWVFKLIYSDWPRLSSNQSLIWKSFKSITRSEAAMKKLEELQMKTVEQAKTIDLMSEDISNFMTERRLLPDQMKNLQLGLHN